MAPKSSIFSDNLDPQDFLPQKKAEIDSGCSRALLAEDLRQALARFGAQPKELLVVSGLGGAVDITELVLGHGARMSPAGVLPFAAGARKNKKSLTVVTVVPHTTGAALSRLIETARTDLDVVCLIINGGCGQRGAEYDAELAGVGGSIGARFIARCIPGEEGTAGTIFEALQRRGFSFVEVVGTCSVCAGTTAADVPDMRGVLIEADPRTPKPQRESVNTEGKASQELDAAWNVFRC